MTTFKIEEKKELNWLLYRPKKQKVPIFIKKPKAIVLAGPTGVGKSKLAISLAEILGGEIISLDAVQVYKGMDIGTAKVSLDEREKIPHHMIDVANVKEEYNVFLFVKEAKRILKEIILREKVPIIVGGSGFYLRCFIYGAPPGPSPDLEVRKKLSDQWEEMGADVMYERLQMLDPEYALKITANDKQKILRALEIIAITKDRVTSHPYPDLTKELEYNYRFWFLYLPKDELKKKLDQRCLEMVQNGFLEEVKRLIKEGILENKSASNAIGYRQALLYLQSKQTPADFEEFIKEFKQASHQYVKRQMTWFRKEPFFRWIDLALMELERVKEYILQDFEQGN